MQILFIIASFLIVSFGQPVWSQTLSFLASTMGFALFFYVLISFDSPKRRYWLATAWFTAVQLVQLSWFLSHPYMYIIAFYSLVALIYGLQFGVVGLFANPKKITQMSRIFFMASCWVFLEWLRLFVLSGFAFNPIGLSLSAHLYSLQTASLWGAYGMSFWVLFVNLLCLKAWLEWPHYKPLLTYILFATFPFIFGSIQLKIFDSKPKDTFHAVLIQPVFPIEESMKFRDSASFIKYVESEWRQILTLAKNHLDKENHLIVLPEFIVPFATYTPVFRFEDVRKTFLEILGDHVKHVLPEPQEPLGTRYSTPVGPLWMVSNGYWLQALANVFNVPVIAGMEDVDDLQDGSRKYFSSAQYVEPNQKPRKPFRRYDKRILVPMGEYIPFSFCSDLAAKYGITRSFTPGSEAKIFPAAVPLSVSICYEETFGHLMRESRLKGAELLVNLTSDAWYPTLAQHHCDHARLRTVENGIPLIRSCNTGITCGFDCFGREIKTLGDNSHDKIWKPGSLHLQVPIVSYPTLYSIFGDYFILALCFIGLAMPWKKDPK